MRFAATLLCWLATTLALAVVVPATWVQRNIVNPDGYAALAEQAAYDPGLQSAMAAELTTRATALIAARNGGRVPADSSQVHTAAAAFTSGPSFPALFAQANRAAHGWLFSDPRSGQDGDGWTVDLAPMLKDPAIAQLLASYRVQVPATLTVPLTVSLSSMSEPVRQGELSPLGDWGSRATTVALVWCGGCAALTLLAARRRGKALTSLGVSALLVGAAGWVGIEVGAPYVNDALNCTTGNVRQVADVMVAHAGAGLREWLDLTLGAGAALVVFGVFVAMAGSVARGKRGS
ncbi:hypothetical protein [Mycobacterium shigaense]|uniref:Uncharacterized protein n=1 Tax=Mycobacterium shigaense TaxID=722731 RepID=A0A1Z4ECZ2_9MYCO|nr:hypothetical protein [Mycobacterium shigaense]MEA1122309.1 hypothetical protein [Mycobacterium shigaense]PRI16983.1 hypothetical protein B2J96_00465 [Mycobacterium shigaense]BAX90827.1 hypothetical protein MSG_00663 [Mycobacterium shigaense]